MALMAAPAHLLGRDSLSLLSNQRLVNVRNNSSSGNGRLDQCVQLLVSSNGQLKMPGGDSLHLEILGGIAGQLEYLSREILQDGRAVHGSGGSNTSSGETAALQMTMDSSNRKLESSSGRSGDCLLF